MPTRHRMDSDAKPKRLIQPSFAVPSLIERLPVFRQKAMVGYQNWSENENFFAKIYCVGAMNSLPCRRAAYVAFLNAVIMRVMLDLAVLKTIKA